MENVELELSFLAVECRESAIGATAAAGSRCVCVGGRLGVGGCVCRCDRAQYGGFHVVSGV